MFILLLLCLCNSQKCYLCLFFYIYICELFHYFFKKLKNSLLPFLAFTEMPILLGWPNDNLEKNTFLFLYRSTLFTNLYPQLDYKFLNLFYPIPTPLPIPRLAFSAQSMSDKCKRWNTVSPDSFLHEEQDEIMLASTIESDHPTVPYTLSEKVQDP